MCCIVFTCVERNPSSSRVGAYMNETNKSQPVASVIIVTLKKKFLLELMVIQ